MALVYRHFYQSSGIIFCIFANVNDTQSDIVGIFQWIVGGFIRTSDKIFQGEIYWGAEFGEDILADFQVVGQWERGIAFVDYGFGSRCG